MVCRFVQDERIRIGEKDAGQFNTPALAAGQVAERILEDILRYAQAFCHNYCIGLCRVSACILKILHCCVISAHSLFHQCRIGHIVFCFAQP